MSDLHNNNTDKINPPLKANNLKDVKDILGNDLKKTSMLLMMVGFFKKMGL